MHVQSSNRNKPRLTSKKEKKKLEWQREREKEGKLKADLLAVGRCGEETYKRGGGDGGGERYKYVALLFLTSIS